MSTGKTTPKTSLQDELRTRMRGRASKFVSGVIKPLLTGLNVELEKAGRKTLVTEVTESFVELIKYNNKCVSEQRAAKTAATRYAKANSPAKPKGIFHPHAAFAQRTKMELKAKLVTEKAKQLRKLKENKGLTKQELGELAYHAITEEDEKSISETTNTMYKAWAKTPEGIEAHEKYNAAKATSPKVGSSSPTEEEREVLYTLIALAYRPTVKHYRAGNAGGARVGNPAKLKDGHEVWEDCISGPPATIEKVLKSIRAAFASDPKLTTIVASALARIGRSSDPKTGAKTSGYDGVTEKMLKKAVKVLSEMIKGKAPATETVEEEVSEEEPESDEEAESDEEEADPDDEGEASDAESEASDKKSDAGDDDTDWGESDVEGKTEEGAPAPASPPTPTPKSPEVTPPAAAAAKPKPKVVKRKSPKVTVSETPVEAESAEPAKPIKPKGKKGKKASGQTPTEVDE